MNHALILAGGTGQRMRSSGLPKQFLEIYGKPIIIHTIEKFIRCPDVDFIVIVCNPNWMNHMETILKKENLPKMSAVVPGGRDRQKSIVNGLAFFNRQGYPDDDIILIHDSVRPLVEVEILSENIRTAGKYGCSMTVRPVEESVVITEQEIASFGDFMERDHTYSLTSPQTFRLGLLRQAYEEIGKLKSPVPLLDAALTCTFRGRGIYMVKENNKNLKITTPEDYYILKAMLELQENKRILGL